MHVFERFAKVATLWAGSNSAIVGASLVIAVWFVWGLLDGFGLTSSLFVNTATTLVTFMMVFLIQRTQNKESIALQMKLNELLAAHQGASNRLLNVEEFTECEILKLRQRYKLLAERCNNGDRARQATVEEIEDD